MNIFSALILIAASSSLAHSKNTSLNQSIRLPIFGSKKPSNTQLQPAATIVPLPTSPIQNQANFTTSAQPDPTIQQQSIQKEESVSNTPQKLIFPQRSTIDLAEKQTNIAAPIVFNNTVPATGATPDLKTVDPNQPSNIALVGSNNPINSPSASKQECDIPQQPVMEFFVPNNGPVLIQDNPAYVYRTPHNQLVIEIRHGDQKPQIITLTPSISSNKRTENIADSLKNLLPVVAVTPYDPPGTFFSGCMLPTYAVSKIGANVSTLAISQSSLSPIQMGNRYLEKVSHTLKASAVPAHLSPLYSILPVTEKLKPVGYQVPQNVVCYFQNNQGTYAYPSANTQAVITLTDTNEILAVNGLFAMQNPLGQYFRMITPINRKLLNLEMSVLNKKLSDDWSKSQQNTPLTTPNVKDISANTLVLYIGRVVATGSTHHSGDTICVARYLVMQNQY